MRKKGKKRKINRPRSIDEHSADVSLPRLHLFTCRKTSFKYFWFEMFDYSKYTRENAPSNYRSRKKTI